ncbi:unnamed protein product, partial [Ectocarpus sp. 12 AP-2014]
GSERRSSGIGYQGAQATLCERKVCLRLSVRVDVCAGRRVFNTPCAAQQLPCRVHAGRLSTLVWVTKLARALRERRQIVPVGVPVPSRTESFILDAPIVFAVFSPLGAHVTYCTLNNTGCKISRSRLHPT